MEQNHIENFVLNQEEKNGEFQPKIKMVNLWS